jgi:putative SOS response-associated peptidase YedK
VILFAGLYEYWQPKPEQWERTFTIVTTDANELMRPVHDRMPVVLSEDAVDQWLLPKQRRGRPATLARAGPRGVAGGHAGLPAGQLGQER